MSSYMCDFDQPMTKAERLHIDALGAGLAGAGKAGAHTSAGRRNHRGWDDAGLTAG